MLTQRIQFWRAIEADTKKKPTKESCNYKGLLGHKKPALIYGDSSTPLHQLVNVVNLAGVHIGLPTLISFKSLKTSRVFSGPHDLLRQL